MTLACSPGKDYRTTHGMSRTPEYSAWASMTGRCENPNHPSYRGYGARGIRVYTGWLHRGGFKAFLDHIGLRPTKLHTLERIDNNRGYEHGNVKWATRSEQMRNTRYNRYIELDGVRKIAHDWARERRLHETVIPRRIAAGMSVREAIMTPGRGPYKRGRVV